MTSAFNEHTGTGESEEFRVVVVNAGTSNPSSTAMLGDRVVEELTHHVDTSGAKLITTVIELRDLAQEIANGLVTGLRGEGLERASRLIADADALVATTPVYKAEASGLFSGFFQVLDRDLLVGTPVVLGATAGTSRHALVIDGQMRSQFAYLRSLVAPTSLFAATEDWNDPNFATRIRRAAGELWLLIESRFAARLRATNWDTYQHDFGSAKSSGDNDEIDLSSDLMRLATGGTLA
ncbi:CE1759 family FMN reductase [Gulosibacter sediminis]|uniref:CE1759 family FMN reductase n=1 Tax=Gulosibacter sediminis TaxID=1729695 RepID=UPI0024A85BB6|nr:CE1759 family FMN reductase [Gulosibacter sediminis]